MSLGNLPIEKFVFKNSSIFNDLTYEEQNVLQSHMVTLKYKKGQIVFHEGAFATGIYILKEGKIKKFKTGADGKEQIFYICKEGEILGYHALISEECYSDSAVTMENCIISIIPKEDFINVLKTSSVLSNHLLKNLSHEFGVLINTITILAQKSVRERLALNLLILKDKYRENEDGDVNIILSRDDLANLIGTAKETLVRLLHDFKEEGLIKTEGKAIILLDIKTLAKIANYK